MISAATLSAMPPQVQVIHSNISSLNHTLGSVRSQLSTHLENEMDAVNNIEAQYDMFVERCKRDKAAVEAGLMDIHSAIERAKAVQENTKLEMNRVDQRIKELKMTKQSEVPSTHGLDMTKLALEAKITKLLEKKRRFLARRQATVEEIRKHLRMFLILGLKFKQGSSAGSIVLEFSNLKHASDAKALCEIKVTGDNSFTRKFAFFVYCDDIVSLVKCDY